MTHGALMEENLLAENWTGQYHVSRNLRATRHEDSSVNEEATIVDYLAHRIGLALRISNLVLRS